MENNIVCVKYGTKYGPEYVNKLYSMVERHLSIPFTFYCITENSAGIDNPLIKFIESPKNLAGWWCKPYVLSKDNGLVGPTLYLDLDIVIIRSIDNIFNFRPSPLNIAKDFIRKFNPDWDKYNSSVFTFDAPDLDIHWRNFYQNSEMNQMTYPGDQDWMYSEIKDVSYFPDAWIRSYKWDVKNQPFLTISDEKNNFDDLPSDIPEECSILVFHGDPKPHEITDKIILENWK
jgi:hypothetical protein